MNKRVKTARLTASDAVVTYKDDGKTITRRVGECVKIRLLAEHHKAAFWRPEFPMRKCLTDFECEQWHSWRAKYGRWSFSYRACCTGTERIVIHYWVGAEKPKTFTLTVEVVPGPPPPVKVVYVVQARTVCTLGDPQDPEREITNVQLGIACSPEGAQELVGREYDRAILKWNEKANRAHVTILYEHKEVRVKARKYSVHW